MWFPCPYFQGEVELTEEREQHIGENHPDLLPEYRDRIADTLADPDQVRRSTRFGNALLFSRWFEEVRGGKHIVLVVLTEGTPNGRNWIITAYIARRLAGGDIVWQRD
jgi:hypothetical protein